MRNIKRKLKDTLHKIIRSGKSENRTVLRAKIILLANEGYKKAQIAKELHCDKRVVYKWLKRFEDNQSLNALKDLSRRGRPMTVPSIAKCEIIKFACSPSQKWTIQKLQEAVLKETGYKISRSQIQRILKNKQICPHKVKMWQHSPDKYFKSKVNKVVSLYLNPPPGAHVLCVDEKTGVQAIEREKWQKKRQIRMETDYERHGTATLIAAFDIRTGHVFAKAGFSRKQEDLNLFMQALALKYPKGDVYIIWDNLNTHLPYQWLQFNKVQEGRFHFEYTPKHASWMNQIEIWLSILQRKAIKNCSFKTVFDLCSKMMDFVREWNEVAHPFKWKFAGYV
jgi:transposase